MRTCKCADDLIAVILIVMLEVISHLYMLLNYVGLMYANGSHSDPGGVTQGDINNIASPSESWLSSSLSAFLDSVPSSPALASENALISRALERVSSFRAGQAIEHISRTGTRHIREAAAAATGTSAVTRRQGNQNGGFLFISFLVGLGAIFWVLTIGATIKVIKGLWGRFTSS